MRNRMLVCWLGASLGIAGVAGAQSLPTGIVTATAQVPVTQQPYSIQPDLTPPEVSDSYQVGPDDLLAIFVFQMPELTSQVRVSAQGVIRLPLLAQPLQIAGLTVNQIGQLLVSSLVRQGLARQPEVRVVVRQVMSHPVVVAGAVRQPIVIQATKPIHLIEALARAGGLSEGAGTEILLTQGSGEAATTRTIAVQDLMSTANAAMDPLLTGNDVVRVLPAHYVYAVGAVMRPNAFPITPDQPMTVLRVLALAQGFSNTDPPKRNGAMIIRTVADERESVPVNLDALLRRSQPDVPLLAGDILYVPTSDKRKVMVSALQFVGQAVALAVGYHAF